MRHSARAITIPLALTLTAGSALAHELRVATDIAPVHSLVARVMQGVGTPDLILPPAASPHGYAMRPSEARTLQEAQAVFWVGPALTPWLDRALDNIAGDAVITSLLDVPGLTLFDYRDGAVFRSAGGHDHDHDHYDHDHDNHDHDEHDDHGHDDHGHDDHGHDHEAHGHDDHDHHDDHKDHGHGHDDDDHGHDDHGHDDHGHDDHGHDHGHDDHGHGHDDHGHDDHDHDHSGTDPHAWLDPVNAMLWLDHIAAVLSDIDPDHAAEFAANAAAGKAEIEIAMTEVTARLAGVRGGHYVVLHDAYQYFEARFDMPATAAIRAGDAATPGAARVAEIRSAMADLGASCILSEPQLPDSLTATITQGTDLSAGVLDPLGSLQEPGAGLYPAMLVGLADAMAECLD